MNEDDIDDAEAPAVRDELIAEIARLKRELRETNHAAAAVRHRLAEHDRNPPGPDDAAPAEAPIAAPAPTEEQRQIARLEADLLAQRLAHEIERMARGLMTYPELAVKLVDRNLIEHDPETGKISGVREALQILLRAAPSLAAGRSRGTGGGSPAAMRFKQPGGNGAALKAREAGQWQGMDRIAEGFEPM